jgi:hypothetical protein
MSPASVATDSRAVESHLNLHGNTGDDFACLHHVRELGLGIRFGSTVKIDLRADSDSAEPGDATVSCLRSVLFRNTAAPMHVSLSGGKQHALQVGLSWADYERWLNFFQRKMMNQVLEAMIPAQENGSPNSASLPSVP